MCIRDRVLADIADWRPDTAPALIFSNAVLHWLPDHAALLPRLAGFLAPGGKLAVQMPRQYGAPSHRFLRDIAQAQFPDRFDFHGWQPPVLPAAAYWPVSYTHLDLYKRQVLVTGADGSRYATISPKDDTLTARLLAKNVEVRAEPQQSSGFMSLISLWLPFIVLIGIWIFFMNRMQGGGRGGAMGLSLIHI